MAKSHLLFKIRQRLRWKLNDQLFSWGMGKRLLQNRPGGRILVYHGIDQKGSRAFNTRFISQLEFDQQVAWMKEHYHLVSLDEYYAGNFAEDRLTVALTFDDGYANNLHYALPVLEKYQVPAAFFVTGIRDTGKNILWPDFLDLATPLLKRPLVIDGEHFHKDRHGELTAASSGRKLKHLAKEADYLFILKLLHAFPSSADPRNLPELEDYWRQLTLDELRELASSPLVTIGSHSYLHTSLGNIPIDNAREEMQESKRFLEKTIGKPIKALAFPDGSYNRKVVEAAHEIGYEQQLAVDFRFPEDESDTALRTRLGLHPHLSWNNQVAVLLKGSYY